MSLSIVPGRPITGSPFRSDALHPCRNRHRRYHQRVDPTFFQVFDSHGADVSSRNSGKRAEPRNVPPRLIIQKRCNGLAVPYGLHTDPDSLINAHYFQTFCQRRTNNPANAAFMPGASPPLVNTPIFLIILPLNFGMQNEICCRKSSCT